MAEEEPRTDISGWARKLGEQLAPSSTWLPRIEPIQLPEIDYDALVADIIEPPSAEQQQELIEAVKALLEHQRDADSESARRHRQEMVAIIIGVVVSVVAVVVTVLVA